MKENKKSFLEKYSSEPSKKYQTENRDKRNPQKRLSIRDMPIKISLHHPHNEEIVDGMP